MAACRPAALVTGLCTGHGVCVPAAIHSFEPCGTPCPLAQKRPVSVKNATCYWPPLVTAPLVPYPSTVFVNGIIPLRDADVLIPHPSPCTNIVMVGPCGDASPKPIPCGCSIITAEDNLGVGHIRVVKALCKSVYVEGRAMGGVGDPLGPPCLSFIGTGSVNVYVGL